MVDVFPKFIIEDGKLIISKATYHKELVTDKEKVKGGGWFRWNEDKSMIIFFGSSDDFGPAKLEDIKACVESKEVYSNIYATHSIADMTEFGYDTGTDVIKL